uniref:Putative reverse transcriptase-like protein n=1 Tax=viral metagenome TaxID=1070528 RepID=A0A6M3J2G4_9ZZZZ
MRGIEVIKVYADGSTTRTAYVIEGVCRGVQPMAHKQTSNVGEYVAVWKAVKKAHEKGLREIEVLSDSELIIKQLKGEYAINNKKLREYALRIWAEAENFDKIEFTWVSREENPAGKMLESVARGATKCQRRLKNDKENT